MALFSRLLRGNEGRAALQPLYQAVVAEARDPAWYREGEVPDTLEGRFDMVAAVLALVLLRLEREEGEREKRASVLLTETFIDDMDGTLRQIGIGDFVVGKHVGRLLGALGGRLGAFRDAFAGAQPLEDAVRRNVFRDAPGSDAGVAAVCTRLRALHDRLSAAALEPMLAGSLPAA